MTRNSASQLLGSFFRGETPFEETKELLGHASTGIPDLFISWFAEQTEADKRVVANVLAESVIEAGDLDKNLPQACFLMVDIARSHPLSIPPEIVTKVEQLFRNRGNIRTWLNDEEGDSDRRKDFRSRWRFALALWNFLWVVGSPVAEESFETFTNQAKDPHFARSIELAKSFPRSKRM